MRWARLVHCGILIWLSLGLVGCSPLKLLNATVPDDGYRVTPAVAYGPNPRHSLDIYFPSNANEPAKVIVFFYGGSWKSGAKEDYGFVGQALASRGFIAVLPDYRLYPEVAFPAFLEDSAKAVAWVKQHIANDGGDPDAVFLAGHSAGAYIAAMLALNPAYLAGQGLGPQELRGIVGLAGPYAFNPRFPSIREVFAHVDDVEIARPITFADGSEPPMLLLHGLEDEEVFLFNSSDLAEKIRAHGGKAELKTYPDIGHFKILLALASVFRDFAPVLDDLATFVDRH